MKIQNLSLKINRTAAGLETTKWFHDLDEDDKAKAIAELVFIVSQSGRPTDDDIEEAVSETSVKSGCTPAVLLRKGSLDKIRLLPSYEHQSSFKLLLAIYRILDQRRRENYCGAHCSHWWHQDPEDWEKLLRERS